MRARFFADRLAELGIDECTTDPLGNPIGLIKGSEPARPPILVMAELDSLYNPSGDIHYELRDGTIQGPGLMDNALGGAAALSLPDMLKRQGISLKSNLMIAGVSNTMRDAKNLTLMDRFVENLEAKPCAALIVKGGELGRLNYFSDAVIRADIVCERRENEKGATEDMVVVATHIVDQLLAIRIPTRPHTALTVGMLKAGFKYGDPAAQARIGIELRSVSNEVVKDISAQIRDIMDLVRFAGFLGWGSLVAIFALVANAIVLSVHDRVKDHAVMQTLGFDGATIAGLIVLEGLVLSIVGGIAGLTVAAIVAHWGQFTFSVEGISVAIETTAAMIAVGMMLSVGIGVLAGLAPALRAARLTTAEAFRAV